MVALALERSAYPQLDSMASALSDWVRSALVRLQTLSNEWHRRIDEEAIFRRETGARGELLNRDLDLYEATGPCQLGLEGELKPGQARMVEGMRRSIAAAVHLVSEVLDFARADAGTLKIVPDSTDCAEIAREAFTQYAGAARAAGHDLQLWVPGSPLPVVTDRDRVMQILGNLLSNAVKYTPSPGRIELTARAGEWARGPSGDPCVELCVRDSGPGIPATERERIFHEFHRLHRGQAEGHGLGLATSRRIARLLGGELTVENGAGGGAVFRLWIPMSTASS